MGIQTPIPARGFAIARNYQLPHMEVIPYSYMYVAPIYASIFQLHGIREISQPKLSIIFLPSNPICTDSSFPVFYIP